MTSRLLLSLIVLATFLGLAAPVQGGGMATVHLDEVPNGVVAGEPWRFGFMVLAHDINPVSVPRAYVRAQHRETGEALEVDARQEGVEGHFVAEMTFPAAGSWKWSITPEPYAGTSFESLEVLDTSGGGGGHAEPTSLAKPVRIHQGDCADLGAVAYPLGDHVAGVATGDGAAIASTGSANATSANDVSISETTLDVTLAELLASPHAIGVHRSAETLSTPAGCGEIGGQIWDGALVVALQPLSGSTNAGIATLREVEGRTTVTLFMMAVAMAPSGPTAQVEIVDNQGGWAFSPARLEIAAGTTVIWTNNTGTSHTVTGEELAFEDSGPFGAGKSYHQTFTEPGTFGYYCSPHPFMTGTIVVT